MDIEILKIVDRHIVYLGLNVSVWRDTYGSPAEETKCTYDNLRP